MAENFVELGAEGINWLTDKHYERAYDHVRGKAKGRDQRDTTVQVDENIAPETQVRSDRRRTKNRLPSPEGELDGDLASRYSTAGAAAGVGAGAAAGDGAASATGGSRRRRDSSLERESETSERVIRQYERERDDPRRKPESVLPDRDLRKLRRDSRMSYANGYAPTQEQGRPRSQPPRGRYYDDEEDGSDYDERGGQRYRSSGKGYDDRDDDDRGYDREVIETERYRGPVRGGAYRQDSYGRQSSYGGGNDPYGAGAVTQYRRSQGDLTEAQSRRSRSHGRRDRDRDRSRSDSRSRSRSAGGSRERGLKGKIDEHFDTSMKGLGVGLAGAVVGGLAGREFGHKHKNRDIVLGALVGGLAANAAETKWRDYKDKKEDRLHSDEEKWDQRWDGRSRSAMR